jgi:hypothetical protein
MHSDPQRIEGLKVWIKDEQVYPAEILAAQDSVAAAVERNLDDLQLKLSVWWPMAVRVLSTTIGVVGAFLLGYLSGLWALWSLPLLFFVGAGAGLMATVLYDLLRTIVRRGSQQS